MLILLSPTKTQKFVDNAAECGIIFEQSKNKVLKLLQNYSIEAIGERMKCSEKIATSTYEHLQSFNEVIPAIYAYNGATFKNLDSSSWSEDDITYANNHLLILSALYGCSKPMSPVGMYRLDFNVKFDINLYDYWKPLLTDYLISRDQVILNLASQEYFNMIDLDSFQKPIITLEFKEASENSFVTKGTYAKIARGKMTKIIIQNKISSLDDLKKVSFDSYKFNASISTHSNFIFTR
ncbi:MAG: YaaA family protein [Erysipelothrix sp.]